MSKDKLEQKIDEDDYTLFDKIMYGGLGYGYFCLPSNLLRIVFTVIFPPLGVAMKFVTQKFPYVDFKKLLMEIDELIYVVILTMFFYIPGLIYALSVINCEEEIPETAKDSDTKSSSKSSTKSASKTKSN